MREATSAASADFILGSGVVVHLVTGSIYAHEGSGCCSKSVGHRHSYCELHYVDRGGCTLMARGRAYGLRAGDHCFLPPYTYHSIVDATPNCIHRCISFELLESGSAANEAEREMLRLTQTGQILHGSSPQLAEELHRLFRLLPVEKESFVSQKRLEALLTLAILDVFEGVLPNCASDAQQKDSLETQRRRLIEDHLYAAYDRYGGSGDLAEKLGVSERQMNRIFQSLYGKSYQEKLQEIRLETALRLLENTDWPIGEIAAFVGYENPSSFFYFIKRQVGETPTGIRQRLVRENKRNQEVWDDGNHGSNPEQTVDSLLSRKTNSTGGARESSGGSQILSMSGESSAPAVRGGNRAEAV